MYLDNENIEDLNENISDVLLSEAENWEPVVLYMRYSSDNQTENSIKYQRAALRAYCINHNISSLSICAEIMRAPQSQS